MFITGIFKSILKKSFSCCMLYAAYTIFFSLFILSMSEIPFPSELKLFIKIALNSSFISSIVFSFICSIGSSTFPLVDILVLSSFLLKNCSYTPIIIDITHIIDIITYIILASFIFCNTSNLKVFNINQQTSIYYTIFLKKTQIF